MNTGQMLLTLGALILLSILTLRVNTGQLSTQDTMQNTKFGVLAVSVASSIMEEASEKAFDTKTDGNFVANLSELTAPNSLGPANGETRDLFNDFDDFNGLVDTITNMPSAVFKVSCTVDYIDPDLPGLTSSIRTWHKRLIIKVTSPSMADTIEMTKIFSYWKFPS
jgi:trimethylamine:corrinoid methyltransferase-like protein